MGKSTINGKEFDNVRDWPQRFCFRLEKDMVVVLSEDTPATITFRCLVGDISRYSGNIFRGDLIFRFERLVDYWKASISKKILDAICTQKLERECEECEAPTAYLIGGKMYKESDLFVFYDEHIVTEGGNHE